MNQGLGSWVLVMILSALTSLVLGLALVWLNIERLDMAYSLRTVQGELDGRTALTAKLEVERDRLMSPYELGRKAEAMGMRGARPGQIRRIEEAGR